MKSIIHGDKEGQCFLCHRNGPTHVHHCLHGSRRKKADDYGLTVHLCPFCHTMLHDHGVNDLFLQQTAQLTFEREYGGKRWMQEFGKSYL